MLFFVYLRATSLALLLFPGLPAPDAPERIAARALSKGADNPTILSLSQAIEQALDHHPALAAARLDVEMAEARILQAGLRPNPKLELETESFGGSGPYGSFDEAESTLSLEQTLETAGKRSKRKKASAVDRDLSQWDVEVLKLEITRMVRERYLEVQAAEEQVRLTGELTQLAQDVYDVVSKKVEAGKVAPLERTRARVALAEARLEQKQLAGELLTARLRLANTWGASTPATEILEGQLPGAVPPPDPRDYKMSANPLISKGQALLEKARASLDLEKANRIPDLDLKAGFKRFEDSGDSAFTLGVGLELPLFNRKKQAVRIARLRISQVEQDQRATELSLELAFQEAYTSLKTAYEEAVLLSGDLLPAAQWAFHSAREGYRLGKFSYLDVADAQRSLFQMQRQHIQALADYHKAAINMEQLAARAPGQWKGGLQ